MKYKILLFVYIMIYQYIYINLEKFKILILSTIKHKWLLILLLKNSKSISLICCYENVEFYHPYIYYILDISNYQ